MALVVCYFMGSFGFPFVFTSAGPRRAHVSCRWSFNVSDGFHHA